MVKGMTARIRKQVSALLLMVMLCAIAGCTKQELNETAIPLGLGLDWQDGQFTLSALIAQPRPPGESGSGSMETGQSLVISANGKTITEAARNNMLSFPRYPLWAHSGLMLIGENLARRDTALFVDFFARNRYVRKNIPLVVARAATAAQVYAVQPPLEPYSANAIATMLRIQENQLGIYVPVKFSDFLEKMATPGVEPTAPQISIARQGEKQVLKLDGTAVFRGRKMVGMLGEKESRGYRWLQKGTIQGGFIVIPSPLDSSKQVVLELTRSMSKIRPEIKNKTITIKIDITAEGNYYEQNSAGNILTLKNIPKLEALANQQIAAEITSCINKAQSLQSDILGWGRLVEASDPSYWAQIKDDWPRLFPVWNMK
jgi:Ger(x)C family germination protein